MNPKQKLIQDLADQLSEKDSLFVVIPNPQSVELPSGYKGDPKMIIQAFIAMMQQHQQIKNLIMQTTINYLNNDKAEIPIFKSELEKLDKTMPWNGVDLN